MLLLQLPLLAAVACAASSGLVVLNASVLGRRFDGIGGLSGGGATSRLLPDYPESQRGDILDLLFKPFFGAGLHTLKVEVGGDTFSGCGTEPSHQHNATDLSFERGYEWWLMQEAMSRNPSVLGFALPWGFPNHIGANNSGYPLNQAQADYMTAFCAGAPAAGGGWQCDYIGVWNERAWSIDYVVGLRNTLDSASLTSTRIVVADNAGGTFNDIAAQLAANASFAASTQVIGVHYPVGSNSTPSAVAAGVPLWSSEDSSTFFDAAGGGCMARITNWNWVFGSMTSTIVWNLITSYLDHLYWYGDSFMGAAYPWSGSYSQESPLWSAAHTAQFAWPGWTYLPSVANAAPGTQGGSGMLPGGGTFVTLVDTTGFSAAVEAAGVAELRACIAAPMTPCDDLPTIMRRLHEEHFAAGDAFRNDGGAQKNRDSAPFHWSMILETTTTSHSQCIRSNPAHAWDVADEQNITVQLGPGLIVPSSVVVWKSVLFTSASEPASYWFQRLADVPVNAETATFVLELVHPDSIISVSSMDRGQRHGAVSPPPPNTPFPSPYSDSFQGYTPEKMPKYFSDQSGSWAVMSRRDGANATAFEQVVVAQPIAWSPNSLYPLTLIGDWNTSDVDVSVDAYIYSRATYIPGGKPTTSLLPCDRSDPSQQWLFNVSAAITLPGSLVDSALGQCFAVDGCNPAPGTDVWMWPCVSDANGTNCASSNQLWMFEAASGLLQTRMASGLCATGVPVEGAPGEFIVQMLTCGAAPQGAYGTFSYDPATALLKAGESDLCLSSQPPGSSAGDATHVAVGLRLGGMTNTSSVASAYSGTFFSYGYFFTVSPDGAWRVYAGSSPTVAAQAFMERDAGPARGWASGGRVLANGTLPEGAMGLQQWHTLRLRAVGSSLSAFFDGVSLAVVDDAAYPVGWAGLSSGWHIAQFANFSMARVA